MNIQNATAQLKATFKKVGHTNVVTTADKVTLYHYETAIVTVESGAVEINNGGYATATTKKFINRALQSVGLNSGISQRKGIWYLSYNGVEEYFSTRAVLLTNV